MVALPDNLAERNAPGDLKRGVITLHPWQQRFRADPARIKVALFHRQAGKDFGAAAEAVDDAFETHEDWYVVSLTQRQTDATFAKARQVADVFKRVLKRQGEVRLSEREYDEYDREIDQHFRCTARTLHLPGGGSVTALPGRDPDTLAGLTGHVIFTEFGLFPKGGYDHWRVIFPLITRGYRILVISTPRGKNTKLHDLVGDPETYSVHVQTILDSVAEGFVLYDNRGRPTTVEAFRKLYGDEAGWRREYLCEFTGDLEALVRWNLLVEAGAMAYPPDLVFRCLDVTAGAGWNPAFFDDLRLLKGGRLEIGWDVARHADLSVAWANWYAPRYQGVRHLARLVVMRDCEFELQRTVVRAGMDAGAGSVGCGDATGLGMDSNETLAKVYADRWRPFTFTAKSKRGIASRIRTSFGDRAQALPPADGETKFIATDVYALQKSGDGDALVVEETPNPLCEDSHCDVAYAGGLALEASTIAYAEPFAWTV